MPSAAVERGLAEAQLEKGGGGKRRNQDMDNGYFYGECDSLDYGDEGLW